MKPNRIFFDKHLAQTTPYPLGLDIVNAEGIFVHDRSGRSYIDLVSGIGVSHLGHGHPAIIKAIQDQAARHLHVMVYGEYVQQPQSDFARELTSLLPSGLDCVYFVNSGTEANEAALKLAKRATGRTRMVSCRGSYHGSTHGSLSVSGNEKKKYAFRPLLPDVHFVRFGVEEDLHMIDADTACFIMESVQGDAGVRIPSSSYLKAVRKRCDETGTMLIFDEIQCGMGRTGKMFAFEHFGVHPDILTLGKALGGGLPIGAMISSTARMELLTYDPPLGHITTFGGHPLICAAGLASLHVFRDEIDFDHVESIGKYIFDRLSSHPMVREIRRIGLFFAIDMANENVVQHVVEGCMRRGLIAFWFLSCPWSFRIAPPLIITREEAERCCTIMLEVMDEASR